MGALRLRRAALRHRLRKMLVLLWTMRRRSVARRRVRLWCILEATSVLPLERRSVRRRRQVGQQMLSLVLVRRRRMEPTPGTEASMRVQARAMWEVAAASAVDRWKGTRRVWVPRRRQQEAVRVRLARRLADVRCEEVRVRRMRRGQLGWRLGLLWWRLVDRWRMHRKRQGRRLERRVPRMRRRRRLLGRQQVVRCCLVGAARRRLVVRLVRVLVVREARLSRRVWQRVLLWLVVVDRRRRRVQQQLTLHDLEAAASMRHNRLRAKRRVRR